MVSCKTCSKTFSTVAKLKRHSAVHVVSCKACSQTFSSESKLKRHFTIHDFSISYPCKQCKFVSSRKDSLKRHYDLYHDDSHAEIESNTVVADSGNIVQKPDELAVGNAISVPDNHFNSNSFDHRLQLPNNFIYAGATQSGTKRDSSNESSTEELAEQVNQTAIRSAVTVAFLMILTFILKSITMYIFGCVAVSIINRVRRKYVKKLLSLDMAWNQTHTSGDLTVMLDQNLHKMCDALENNIPESLMQIADISYCIILSLIIRWDMTLITGSCTLPTIALYIFGTKHYLRMLANEDGYISRATELAAEGFQAIKTVMCFNGQRQTIRRYEANITAAMSYSRKRALNSSLVDATKILCGDISSVLGLSYSALVLGDWNPGFAVAIVFSFYMMFTTMVPLLNMHMNAIFVGMASAQEINNILLIEPEIEQTKGKILQQIGPRISFENVSFSYPSRETVTVLKDFSLDIKPEDKIGIVGPSGSGKSTVTSLLLRLYDPTVGRITLDGEPLEDLDVSWLREQFGFVSQEPVLFNMTVRENIQCAKQNATETEIIEALKQANAYDFVTKMPEGLDTCVGEGGAQFSGGQKQRIAIARALVRNPTVIVFDEATSALDSESEDAVTQAMDMVSKFHTTITIAHRLSTVLDSSHILVLNDGSIKEYGDPQQLIDKKGIFYTMLQQQKIGRAIMASDQCQQPPNQKHANTVLVKSDNDSNSSPQNLKSKSSYSPLAQNNENGSISGPRAYNSMFGHSKLLWILILLASVARAARVIIYCVTISVIIDAHSYFDEEERQARVIYGLILFFIGEVVGFCGEIGMHIPVPLYSDKLSSKIRSLLLTHYLSQNMAYFDGENHDSGTINATLSTHPANIRETISSKGPETMTGIALVITGFVTSLCIQPYMALYATALWLFIVLFRAVEMKALLKEEKKLQPLQDNANKFAFEALQNLATVKAYCLEEYFTDKHCDEYRVVNRQKLKTILVNASLTAGTASLKILTLSLNILFGAYLMRRFSVSVLAFQAAQAIIQQALVRFLLALSQSRGIARSFASFNTIAKILSEPTPINYLTNAGLTPQVNGKIDFNFVKFHYPARSKAAIFDKLNLHIEPGTTVAIVGASGCGKSTVMNLILRLYEPTIGVVQIDGIDISTINPSHLHNLIVPVSQEPVLFSGTIWDNICYGLDSDKMTPSQVFAAAKTANIHDFIQSLPEKYGTKVGDFGAQLSGGEKQRIAIARALIRHPPILLLDEATSALDTANENLVQLALERAQCKCTCVTIAHRLSTIQNVQTILVMEGGRIVENGTHDELLSQEGLYHQMHEQQMND